MQHCHRYCCADLFVEMLNCKTSAHVDLCVLCYENTEDPCSVLCNGCNKSALLGKFNDRHSCRRCTNMLDYRESTHLKCNKKLDYIIDAVQYDYITVCDGHKKSLDGGMLYSIKMYNGLLIDMANLYIEAFNEKLERIDSLKNIYDKLKGLEIEMNIQHGKMISLFNNQL